MHGYKKPGNKGKINHAARDRYAGYMCNEQYRGMPSPAPGPHFEHEKVPSATANIVGYPMMGKKKKGGSYIG